MSSIVFNACERTEAGKKVRENGEIPCVLYGSHLKTNISLKMTEREMYKLLGSVKNSVFSLNIDGKNENCVLKEVQRNNMGKIIHLDFQNVANDESIKMNVPVVFTDEGKLQGKGLLLDVLVSEVELYGESDKFPENIEYNVGALEYGAKVFARDLKIPEGFKLDIKDDVLVATVAGNGAVEEDDDSEK